MALDAMGLRLIAPHVRGAAVLCLGYPDLTAGLDVVREALGVEPQTFTNHGRDHKVGEVIPETVATFKRAGAEVVDCVDAMPSRGCERVVDLNVRQAWPREYDLVINPGTLEHCFDVATAFFNAWRALKVGGHLLHVCPLTMVNHGFWNVCPTAIADFHAANGGEIVKMTARDGGWDAMLIEPAKRFRMPPECVLYALVRKAAAVPECVPTQARFS